MGGRFGARAWGVVGVVFVVLAGEAGALRARRPVVLGFGSHRGGALDDLWTAGEWRDNETSGAEASCVVAHGRDRKMMILKKKVVGLRGGGLGGSVVATTRQLATGRFGPLAFSAIYVAIETCGVPSQALAVLAGSLYPAALALALVLGSSLTSALIGFCVGRTVMRPAVQRKLATDPTLRAVDRAVAHNGFKVILLLRLVPMPPLINYVYGASSARLADYLAATAVGYLPGTLACVFSTTVLATSASSENRLHRLPVPYKLAAAVLLAAGLVTATTGAARAVAKTLDDYRDDRPYAPSP